MRKTSEPTSAQRLARAIAASPALVTIRAERRPLDDPGPGARVVLVSAVDAVGASVGYVLVSVAHLVRPECQDDLEYVGSLLGRRRTELRPCVVASAFIDDEYVGRGLGAELYVTAAWWVAQEFRQPLMAHDCGGGSTSDAAHRVWASKRFRARASVRGLVAAWPVGEELADPRTITLPPRPKGRRRTSR